MKEPTTGKPLERKTLVDVTEANALSAAINSMADMALLQANRRRSASSFWTGIRQAASAVVVIFLALLVVPLAAPSSGYPVALIPSSGAYLGAYVGQRSEETKAEAIARVENQIGGKLAIDHEYYKWDSPIPTPQESWAVGQGMIPFLNWKAKRLNGVTVPWSTIASGAEDAAIAARADAIKAFGYPLYLTFHHEPEDDLATWGTPADYAAAFRHVVDVFRGRGVTNVAFVWTMMNWTFDPRSGRDPNAYYPGDSYVDLIGVDGFNWYPGRAGAPWESFQQVFQTSNDFAVAHSEPWMAIPTNQVARGSGSGISLRPPRPGPC
jgi:Glycosyl hydrolase family 26